MVFCRALLFYITLQTEDNSVFHNTQTLYYYDNQRNEWRELLRDWTRTGHIQHCRRQLRLSVFSRIEALPHVAHKFVDTAIANNGLSLFDGNVVFDRDDLVELKNYLDWNLPVGASPDYEVKTSGDNTQTTQTP